jgi:hypothetical protein
MTLVLDVWTPEVPERARRRTFAAKYKVAILAAYDTKSLRNLADELAGEGHKVSAPTVAALLREENFSLQGNTKTIEGGRHPDRDARFSHINAQAEAHLAAGQPVISVDGTKKELVGNVSNGGQKYRPVGEPVQTNIYDFKGELGKVTPYGVYDMASNTGWVSVGSDHDTGRFTVESIRRWWDKVGRLAYPTAARLLITADGGGSNGYRLRLWKRELADLATKTGLAITVCHFPPGTSKWNKIEHRLFSHISMNWRGPPLAGKQWTFGYYNTTLRQHAKHQGDRDAWRPQEPAITAHVLSRTSRPTAQPTRHQPDATAYLHLLHSLAGTQARTSTL